jgi:hypothetical protein
MYWLVLYIASGYPAPSAAIAILPEKYPTEQACKEAAKSWSPNKAECIPAPVAVTLSKPCDNPNGICPLPQYDSQGNLKVNPYPGYYCGQYPCAIGNTPNCVTNISSGKVECN